MGIHKEKIIKKEQFRSMPFWSWNGKLKERELLNQIEWMKEQGIGGFFMHARGGLKTEYMGEEWFSFVNACAEKANEEGMSAYGYDEKGWPSCIGGGELLKNRENQGKVLTYSIGKYDEKAFVSYDLAGMKIVITANGSNCLNVYLNDFVPSVDVLNGKVVDKFIAQVYEVYRKRVGNKIKGFFTDEPHYNYTPYSQAIEEYFLKNYHENIKEKLGLLFVEKEGFRAFRYKYWTAISSLFVNNYVKKIYDWCEENGYEFTGHFIDESCLTGQMLYCAGVMPCYEFEHIPAIDFVGGSCDLDPKQVGSVAAQLGKRKVLSETFAALGWNVTPRKLKVIAENQYLSGVNIMCQHLVPYAEYGQRKRDFPAHFTPLNPWVKHSFKEFNDYFTELGYLLGNSREIINVAVLHPIRSAYLYFKRDDDLNGFGIKELEESFVALRKTLNDEQIPYHLIDETILEKYGAAENRQLICGKCIYNFLILPKIYTMGKATEKILREYVASGGKIFLYDKLPEYLEGEKHDYGYINGTTSLREIKNAQEYSVNKTEGLRTSFRVDDKGDAFIFAVNSSEEKDVEFHLEKAKSLKWVDLITGEKRIESLSVHFDSAESKILYLSDEQPYNIPNKEMLELNAPFEIVGRTDNYFPVDILRISYDGINFGESQYHLEASDRLLVSRYKGKLYLKYEFTIKNIPHNCLLLIEYDDVKKIKVNGRLVEHGRQIDNEIGRNEFDVSKYLKHGKNEVIVEKEYFQSESVYEECFGAAHEVLQNSAAYDSEIEPIYLKGDFGVYGDILEIAEGRYALKNCYIAEQRGRVNDLVKDGFPFFKGDLSLKKTVNLKQTNFEWKMPKDVSYAEIYVNGTLCGGASLKGKIDLSKNLVVGDNEIIVLISVGLRNIFGPLHEKRESGLISPFSFYWKNINDKGEIVPSDKTYYCVKTLI